MHFHIAVTQDIVNIHILFYYTGSMVVLVVVLRCVQVTGVTAKPCNEAKCCTTVTPAMTNVYSHYSACYEYRMSFVFFVSL